MSPEAATYDDYLILFTNDPDEPLGLQEEEIRTEAGVTVSDISYYSPIKGRVKAYLVAPPSEGPFAGAIFFHWYEPGAATNNRTEFLEEALTLAEDGVVSLLVQGILPWSRPPKVSDHEVDRNAVVQQVLDVRRGVDVLLSRPGVDPERLAYVGHDFGAMYGAVLGGIDPRIQSYVFMASTSSFSNWFLRYWPTQSPVDKEAYRAAMLTVDPLTYLPHLSAASLFQFADRDDYVSPADGEEQFEAAPEPKTIKWYHADHKLDDFAQRDRLAWLKARLGLGGG